MIVIIGLVILLAATVVGVAGVLANGGDGHAMGGQFAVFGYHVTGWTGALFLYGIVLGAIGMLGLCLLLTGARRTALRGRTARRDLQQSRRETASVSRDRQERVDARQGEPGPVGTVRGDSSPAGAYRRADHGRRRRFGHWPASRRPAPPADRADRAEPRDRVEPGHGDTHQASTIAADPVTH